MNGTTTTKKHVLFTNMIASCRSYKASTDCASEYSPIGNLFRLFHSFTCCSYGVQTSTGGWKVHTWWTTTQPPWRMAYLTTMPQQWKWLSSTVSRKKVREGKICLFFRIVTFLSSKFNYSSVRRVLQPRSSPTIVIVIIVIIYYFIQEQINCPAIVTTVVIHVRARQISEYSTVSLGKTLTLIPSAECYFTLDDIRRFWMYLVVALSPLRKVFFSVLNMFGLFTHFGISIYFI
jgi:hypothetical protein